MRVAKFWTLCGIFFSLPFTYNDWKTIFSINLQSLFDSRSIYFGELRQSLRCANHSGSNRGLTRRDDNYSVIVS